MTVLDPSCAGARVVIHDAVPRAPAVAEAWDELAAGAQSPFASHAWLSAWCGVFAPASATVLLLNGADGALRGAACLVRRPGRALVAAANHLSDGWDAAAADEAARRALWEAIGGLPAARLELVGLPASGPGIALARAALTTRGYRLVVRCHEVGPRLELPATVEDLLGTVSRNLRSQAGRFRRRLEREGRVTFRTTTGPEIDRELECFLQLEASGWKGVRGTAIRNDPRALRLYRDFAHAAARRGWLRLRLLELDGTAIAGDLSCVLGGCELLLKTAFDQRYARLSPGLVLRAAVLEAAIAEGLSSYDFLGGPDRYKLQWAPEAGQSAVVHAYRGMPGLAAYTYQHGLRPAARRLRSIGAAR